MKYRIERYRQIKLAEIEGQVILLQGPNKAGKSSCFWSIRSLLLNNVFPDIRHLRQGWKKEELVELVQGQQGQAAVRAEFDDGGVATMVWPDGIYETQGVIPYVSPTCAGMLSANLAAMDEKQRAEALGNLLLTKITLEDFRAALPDFPSPPPAQPDGKPGQDIPALLQMSCRNKGWTATLAAAKDKLLEYKKAWQGITGEAWGSQKMLSWRPEGWSPQLESLTAQAAQAALEAAADAEREALQGAEVQGGEIAKLQQLAALVPAHMEQLNNAQARKTQALEQLEAANAVKAKLPVLVDDVKAIPCPHCDEGVVVNLKTKGGVTTITLHKPEDAAIPENTRKKLRSSHTDANQQIENAEQELKRAEFAIMTAERDLGIAQEAQAKVEGIEGVDPVKVEAARNQVSRAQMNVTMLQKVAKARTYAGVIGQSLAVIDALEPTGIRKTVMERYLPEINKVLAEVSQGLRIPPVTLSTNGFEVMIGEKRYRNESDSEQFRARIALQIATAAIDGSKIILIDNDVDMDRNYYGSVVKTLLMRKLSGIISVRANPGEKPPFNTAKSNDAAIRERVSSYWLDGGTARLLTAEETKEAAQ